MPMSEAAVMSRVRAAASQSRLFRNNVGVAVDATGRHIRYGLANDSATIARRMKSSDLIGFTPRVVTASDVGRMTAVFTAIECKREGWEFKGDAHETAQFNFINLVKSYGGFAGFCSDVDELPYILTRD